MIARWTPEQDAELRRLYTEGRTWTEIAKTFGVTRGAAVARGHRIGLTPGKSAVRLSSGLLSPLRTLFPHVAVLANSRAPQRSEGGHPLPAGDALTWSLVICNTPTLEDQAWPEAGV
jgi:hypothetical protein